jgi:hypothetical protein
MVFELIRLHSPESLEQSQLCYQLLLNFEDFHSLVKGFMFKFCSGWEAYRLD